MTKPKKERGFGYGFAGLLINLLLSIGKFFGGIFGNSTALIADALHSASDILTDICVMVGIHFSAQPPDDTHKYGHGKFETFASMIVGIVVFGTGMYLAKRGMEDSILAFHGATLKKPRIVAIIIAAISVLTKEVLFRATIAKANNINSNALEANAWHHRSDALSSLAVLIGIASARLLGENWRILDPIAALIVSFFVMIAAYRIARNAVIELLETSLPEDIEENILNIVSNVEGVKNPHNLKTRRLGPDYAIDLHIEVEPSITVEKGHAIANEVEKALFEEFGEDTVVSTHVEPEGECRFQKRQEKEC
jgi:cation diffusion facilitator family transporter